MISIPYIMTKKAIGGDGVVGILPLFQCGKGKIKRPVSSDEQEKANGTSASGATAKQHNTSDNDCYADQETVRALTAALTDAETRCQVLQETLAMVSDDFIQSARDLVQANLRIEQLEFKMQAVTFWDANDRDRDTPSSSAAVVDLPADAQGYYSQGVESDLHKSPSKRSDSRGQRQRCARIVASSCEEDSPDEDTRDSNSRGSWRSLKRQNPKYTRDKSQEQKRSQKKESQDTDGDSDSDSDSDSPLEEPPITPRQAAFVRVMWERDLAQTQARQLTQLLLEKREECFYLSEKLSKTTTLVELAYQDDDVYDDQDTGRRLKWRPGSSDGYDLSWLTDDGTDSTDSSTGIDDDDPELSAIEMQLDAYCSIDTDRAAGLAAE
jgi:hypothetical protein